MSRRSKIFILIAVLIVTNLMTFLITNLVKLSYNEKMLIPASEYESLKADQEENVKLEHIRELIKTRYLRDVSEELLVDGQLKGMVAALEDPYSGYMNEEEFKDFNEQTVGKYAGVGIMVTPAKGKYITIVAPIKGTPGERAGLRTGDRILKINDVEYLSEELDKAVKNMKGEPDTDVKLTIGRSQEGKEEEIFDVVITREIIKIESVVPDILEGDLGYIQITSFDTDTDKDFRKWLKDLQTKGIKGLIIDLRGNPGGLLDVCVNIADELLGSGDIVYTMTKSGKKTYSRSDARMFKLPIVVLIDQGSASASEILSGTLKANGRATIIGETSFGKGVVQRIHNLGDGTALKLTESQYYLPDGTSIDGIGVSPDIEVKLDPDAKLGPKNLEFDNQLKRAVEELQKLIP